MRTLTRRPRTHTLIAATGAAALLVFALALTGCQQSTGTDADRVADLERQVAELQEQIDQTDAASSSAAADATASSSASSAASAADATPVNDTIAGYETRVAELEDACASVEASGDRSADYSTFLDMKTELDQLEREMDAYDDEQELAARQGSLSREDYIAIERAIDALDERLDRAEDSLEVTLRVDD